MPSLAIQAQRNQPEDAAAYMAKALAVAAENADALSVADLISHARADLASARDL